MYLLTYLLKKQWSELSLPGKEMPRDIAQPWIGIEVFGL